MAERPAQAGARPDRMLNWSDHDAAPRDRGSRPVRFDPGMTWHAAPSGRRGRLPTFSDAAIQACLTSKAPFGRPPRRRDHSTH